MTEPFSTAEAVLDDVYRDLNRGSQSVDYANVIVREHPTLTGKLAKAVGLGIMRHTMRDLTWRAFDKTTDVPTCGASGQTVELGNGERFALPKHPVHDGRWDCQTVFAAELLARQSFI